MARKLSSDMHRRIEMRLSLRNSLYDLRSSKFFGYEHPIQKLFMAMETINDRELAWLQEDVHNQELMDNIAE